MKLALTTFVLYWCKDCMCRCEIRRFAASWTHALGVVREQKQWRGTQHVSEHGTVFIGMSHFLPDLAML